MKNDGVGHPGHNHLEFRALRKLLSEMHFKYDCYVSRIFYEVALSTPSIQNSIH